MRRQLPISPWSLLLEVGTYLDSFDWECAKATLETKKIFAIALKRPALDRVEAPTFRCGTDSNYFPPSVLTLSQSYDQFTKNLQIYDHF